VNPLEVLMSAWRMLSRTTVTSGLLLAAEAAALHAQARVHGIIRDSTQGTPLPLVEVLVEGMNLSTRTDAQGRYSLIIPLGFHTLHFRRVGYHPLTRQLRLNSQDPLQYDLTMLSQAQRLDSVQVVAPERPKIWPPGIEDRKKEGFGTFIADSILRRFDHSTLPIVLGSRANAVRVIRVQGRQIAINRRGNPMGKDCAMAVWRDGILLYAGVGEPPDLGQFGVVHLTEIEVYNMATLPSQFRAGGGRCGAIVIWTRQSLSPDGERR